MANEPTPKKAGTAASKVLRVALGSDAAEVRKGL